MSPLLRLHDAVAAVCPIYGVRGTNAADASADYRPEATAPQIAAALAAIAAFNWAASADATYEAQRAKAAATAGIDLGSLQAGDKVERLMVAFVEMILDEFNLHAAKHNAILNAIDNNATVALIKTAVLAIPDYPTRTKAQLVTALKAKIAATAE